MLYCGAAQALGKDEYKMKKLFLILTCVIMAFSVCACGSTPEPIPDINPSELITTDELAALIGYQPTLDGGTVKQDGVFKSAMYVSDPIGQGDPVDIRIYQYNDATPIENVWYSYDTARASRESAEEVTELGESAYIAFPSINIYDRGCYIRITAGSGNDDNQKNLLLSIAKTAVANLEEIMPAPNVNAVEQK